MVSRHSLVTKINSSYLPSAPQPPPPHPPISPLQRGRCEKENLGNSKHNVPVCKNYRVNGLPCIHLDYQHFWPWFVYFFFSFSVPRKSLSSYSTESVSYIFIVSVYSSMVCRSRLAFVVSLTGSVRSRTLYWPTVLYIVYYVQPVSVSMQDF